MSIEPDTKDWTWVLERPCPECGFVASDVALSEIGTLVRQNAARWPAVLGREDVRERPDDATWSPLEYAAHVRDVHRVFIERLALMLEADDPEFENWDQDAAAVAGRYGELSPRTVAEELIAGAALAGAAFDAVPDDAAERTGRRGGGSRFTVTTLGRYYAHDIVHHLHDVAG